MAVGCIRENDDGSTKSKLWSCEVRQRWLEVPESLYEVVDLDLDRCIVHKQSTAQVIDE